MNEQNFTTARITFLADTIHNKYPIYYMECSIYGEYALCYSSR